MSSAESSYQQSVLQRVSTPLFLVLSFVLVFAGTSVSIFAAMIVCVIAGVENSDLQARLGLAATLIGFVGSIYLLIRARRFPPSPQLFIKILPPALAGSHRLVRIILHRIRRYVCGIGGECQCIRVNSPA